MTPFASRFRHPAQVVVAAFGLAIAIGTVLLALPISSTTGESAGWVTALFTSTSAVCVTGLAVVDTATHWSVFGELVIAALVQVGGLGIMTMATVFTLLVSRRLGLRARIVVQAETKTLSMSDVRQVLRKVVVFSLLCEAVAATILTSRFMIGYDESFGRALYLGVFHAISAFNDAGFALWPDSLMRFVTDGWICLTVAIASIISGLGFPVVFELARSWRQPAKWTILTKITVSVTATLLVLGTLAFLAIEWRNPKTLGPLDDGGKLLAAFFAAVMPRSAGFNTLDISQMYPSSWLTTDVLMFIGGGSAGTAGGIKVTTVGLLVFVVWAELRGESRVHIGHRSLPDSAQRQAVTITALGVAIVGIATYALLALTPYSLDQILFEVIAAFGTAGLSTGITAGLGTAGHLLLVVLMFIGRIGPLTLGSALALNRRARHYELPEERIIVG
ncbi:TrkH family potassium uptake protein [Nonomuraea sp. MG754425]|uniref:TrkH family potassium uptake protein n=1 Tax=Nonomuraea sp. MG754425 TaxID=2570319 RepID=UPI001F476C37|nr:potassium transporter TrkG [Nonomuraea sp. MG754425]MCF6476685.1 TrkH family potassium uptake protein [Nonomuraea sp. MG754425]